MPSDTKLVSQLTLFFFKELVATLQFPVESF